LKALRAHPAAKCSENRAFSPEKATAIGKNRSLFQPLARKIRYLADQWKINGIFSPINEFFAPNNRITMEVVQLGKTGRDVVTYQRSMPRRRTPTTMREIDPSRTLSAAPESKRRAECPWPDP
jgi:hypothetical protein